MSQFDDILAKHGIKSQDQGEVDSFDAILKKHGIGAQPDEKPQGFLSNAADLAVGGARSALTAARLSGDVATGSFDQNAPALISQSMQDQRKPKPKELTEVEQAFAKPAHEYEQAGAWSDNPLDKLAAIGKTIWTVGEQAIANPKGTAYLTASQIANMAPSIVGMMGGAKAGAMAGSPFGPVGAGVGAVAGGVAGGFAGEWPMEAGSEFVGAIGKELQRRGMDASENNIAALLADKKFMDVALSDVRTKATTTSAVDAAFTMGAGRLATGPARAAEKAARAELGAGANAAQIAQRTKEILKTRTLPQKIGTGAKAVGLDVAGGGASEAAGQYAGYGSVDLADVGQEMLGELGGAGIEVPSAAWSAGKGAMGGGSTQPATPTPPPAGTSPSSLPPTAAGASPLAAPPPLNQADPGAELLKPRAPNALDRVAELDKEAANLKARKMELSPDNGYGPMFDGERQEIVTRQLEIAQERADLAKDWPVHTPGAPVSFSTETGAKLDGTFALMEADDLVSSHDTNLRKDARYPAELQPRERERAASEMQISSIVQKLDPARLGESPDAATGAPIVGLDGLIESGNARTIALKRVYQANGQKAEDYKTFLKTNADRFGVSPEWVDTMRKPVLVRVRTTPVDRAEFARQANATTVAQMSPSEQARSDAARIDNLDDLTPDENGDFTTGTSRDFVRRFMGNLAPTERAGLMDASGALSQSGYARIRNAVLAKAYGDSGVLQRMVESLDDNLRNIGKALTQAAPKVAKARAAIQDGALFNADITPDLMAAVEELSRLKESGTSVDDALAQKGMFGEKHTPETRALIRFLADNTRRPRKIADFMQSYFDGLNAAGNPGQSSLLGETQAPSKADLMQAAYRATVGMDAREQADANWNAALADLGVIARNLAGVNRMLPEDTPNLMPTLVKLFGAGLTKVGFDVRDLMRYVKNALKAIPEFKTLWNKIPDEVYRKAAQQAIDAHQSGDAGGQMDMFAAASAPVGGQVDLFSQAVKPATSRETPVGQPAANTSTPSQATRSKPKTRIAFDGITGPTGAKLTGYEWAWKPYAYVDRLGEDREGRESDWDNAETNVETGRDIVHKFTVAQAGNEQTVSLETALQLLGFAESGSLSVKGVANTAKRVAKIKMAIAELEPVADAYDKAKAEVDAMPYPPITVEGIWARMGDAMVRRRSDDAFYVAGEKKTLELSWKEKRMAERGFKGIQSPHDVIADLKAKLERAERKMAEAVKAAANSSDKPTEAPRLSRAVPWYSPLNRAIQSAKRDTMPGEQWRLWLQGNKASLGVKDDELQFSGVLDYLALRGKDKVTKAEIADYLSGNGVVVEDVVKAETMPMGTVRVRYMAAMRRQGATQDEAEKMFAAMQDFAEDNDHDEKAKDRGFRMVMEDGEMTGNEIHDVAGNFGGGDTKFSGYWDSSYKGGIPGTYREILVTLPGLGKDKFKYAVMSPDGTRYDGPVWDSRDKAERMDALLGGGREIRALRQEGEGQFRSTHWPDTPNVLVHVRLDEVMGADGKRYVRVGEVQSDWGQAGKKEGFKVDESPRKATTATRQDGYWEVRDQNGDFITNVQDYALPDADEAKALEVAQARLQAQHVGETAQSQRVPTAPFVTDTKAWVALGIKRAIRHAVDVGADGIVFGTGEQNANLYDLSKQVDRLDIEPYGIESGVQQYRVTAMKDGARAIDRTVAEPELSNVVGKDIAKEAIAGKTRFEGEGLRVGGEGMRAFYDQIVPQVANDVLKKIGGGKVSAVETEGGKQPGFPIPNELREKLEREGMPLFARGEGKGIALRDLNAMVDRVRKSMNNLPTVHVLTSPMALDLNNPSQARLREFIEQAGALDDVEGAAHEGEIYLFASGLADEARAEHVLAVHEITHYGLRAVFGMDLDPVLQSIWATNANIRKQATALREKLGLASNVAAVEEILADMEPAELVKLTGWRRLAQVVRDWFRGHGFTALADRIDSLLKAGLDGQRQADLLVADVVNAARGWVKGGKRVGKVASGTALQRVWHGTPHIWVPEHGFPHGRPRLDKIGTGEGAQAYGWGWYSAQSQGVAKYYLMEQYGPMPPTGLLAAAVSIRHRYADDAKKAAFMKQMWPEYSDKDISDAIAQAKELKPVNESSLYQLDIPDEVLQHLLDWDKPLSEQTPEVKSLLNSGGDDIGRKVRDRWVTDEWGDTPGSPTGAFLYETLKNKLGGKKAASEYLASIGIVGNRYLDGQSRNRPLKDIKREFLAELPEDADASEVAELIGTGKLSPKNDALLRALKNDDWLGFDYPAQAVSAALSNDLSGYDASPELIRAVADAKEGGTYNFVIWNQPTLDKIALLERNGEKMDAMREADARKLADDLPAQEKWLNTEARMRGFQGIEDLAAKDYKVFENLAKLWREKHPADVMLSRAGQSQLPGVQQSPPAPPPSQQSANLQGGASGNQSVFNTPEPSKMDDIIFKLQDKHIDLKRAIQGITDAGRQIADKWNTYMQEELFHGRTAKRVQDFADRELAPMLREMALRKVSIADLDKYLWARHAKEANALIEQRDPGVMVDDVTGQPKGSGMTDLEADDYLAGLSQDQRNQLDAIARQVDRMIAKTRDLYVSYGLENRDTVQGWADMFQHYVPLMREDRDGGMGIGQGFSIKGREAKHRTGSTRAVADVLANIATQRERAIVRGEKNRVAVSLAGLVKLNTAPDFWTLDKIPQERVLNEQTGLVETREVPNYRTRDNVIIAKIKDSNGNVQERAIVLNENDERAVRLAKSMKNIDIPMLEGWLGSAAAVTRYFSAINTQYNPVFGVVNLIRDMGTGALNLSSTALKGKERVVTNPRRIASAVAGIYSDARKERKGQVGTSPWATLWEEFTKEGGQTGYRDMFRTSNERANAMQQVMDPTSWTESKWGQFFTANGALKVPLVTIQKAATPLFNWLSDFNLAMENAVRLSAYKEAVDSGMSKQQAASLAKNMTVNFNRKGAWGAQAGALYAFFNAATQGTARIGETLTRRDHVTGKYSVSGVGKKIIGGGVMLGVMQAVALAMAGYDDDEPPEFIRERNIVVPLMDGKYISIPMPLGFHVIPNIGRIATETLMGRRGSAIEGVIDLMGITFEAFNPIGSAGWSTQTVLPTVFDPMAAIIENKDWTGKPIAKEKFSNTDPEPGFAMAKDNASAVSTAIAYAINLSTGGSEYTAGKISPTPDQIDYLWGQVTGGVGREGNKLYQSVESLFTGEELPPHKIPLAGRLYGNTQSSSAMNSRFYDNIRDMKRHKAEYMGRMENGDTDGAQQYLADNPEAEMIRAVGAYESNVQQLRSAKRKAIEQGDSERAKEIEQRTKELMEQFNQQIGSAKQ